jgi:hypothetical protein
MRTCSPDELKTRPITIDNPALSVRAVRRHGKPKPKRGALPDGALDLQGLIVQLKNGVGDGEAQPGPAAVAVAALVDAVEPLDEADVGPNAGVSLRQIGP